MMSPNHNDRAALVCDEADVSDGASEFCVLAAVVPDSGIGKVFEESRRVLVDGSDETAGGAGGVGCAVG